MYVVASQDPYGHIPRTVGPGRYFCTSCGDARRMKFSILKAPNLAEQQGRVPGKINRADPGPAMFLYQCGECDATYLAIIYRNPGGARLAVFAEAGGGLATDNTPPAVAYYLDEAHNAQSVGANSAAVTMYRAG